MSNTVAIHNINHNIQSSLLNKRQAVASTQCGKESNNVTICVPNPDSIWYNDTDQEITWKYNNPKFNGYELVDLYLLYQPYEGSYEVVKSWLGLVRSQGVLVQHIDDSWYPLPIDHNSSNITWSMYFYICGANYSIQEDFELIPTAHNYFPEPRLFNLIQTPLTTPTSTILSSSLPTLTEKTLGNDNSNIKNENNKKLPGWAIAVIVIAALILIAAFLLSAWAFKKYKDRKSNRAIGINTTDDEKLLVMTPLKNDSTVAASPQQTKGGGDLSSIYSGNPPVWTSPRSMSPHDLSTGVEKVEIYSPPQNGSSSILSSTDALMIADTFRQFMRKPEWNDDLDQTVVEEKEPEKKKN